MLKKIFHQIDLELHNYGIGRYSAILGKNKRLRGSAMDKKRCFILATGPSIKEQDLSKLQDEFCISVSNFFVHSFFKKIQPKYHIFAASHPPITPQHMANWWQDAVNHFQDMPVNVFINIKDKKIVNEFDLFKTQNLYYYLGEGRYPVDFTKPIPKIQTVVHIAIYLAMFLGFKEIYLLGCDHSWILHYGISQHFYEEKQHSFTRNNYNEWSEVKDIGYEFKTYASLWDIYRNIKVEATKNNIQIYNATPGSLLDIFPKIELVEIFNHPNNA